MAHIIFKHVKENGTRWIMEQYNEYFDAAITSGNLTNAATGDSLPPVARWMLGQALLDGEMPENKLAELVKFANLGG